MKDIKIRVLDVVAPFIIIVCAVLLRLLPHPANMTPIAAMALFGGVYFPKRYALLLPLVIMLISDFFLGFHESMLFVYGSFVITGCIGIFIRRRKTPGAIIIGSLVSSVLFFIITNFGFWLSNDLYPKTLAGQLDAYIMALPFFRNTVIGDLLYSGLFFGGYATVRAFLIRHEQKLEAQNLKF